MDLPLLSPISALLLITTTALVINAVSFTPTDNHLISCGSSTTHRIDNRLFVGDQTRTHSSTFRLTSSSSSSYSLPNPNDQANKYLPPIYLTARVFNSPSGYHFSIQRKGTHILRLHFRDCLSGNARAEFRVYAGGFLLIEDGVETVHPESVDVIKEFFLTVDVDEFEVRFVPKKGSYAYVNAIEVISAPDDLIVDVASLVGDGEKPREVYHGLSKQALETLYRVNVGGPKVTPFNDSLWRTWLPDDSYTVSMDAVGVVKVHSTGPIKYQDYGATREVAPDFVYSTARVITSEGMSSVPNSNITWIFPVETGYSYLVRLHFCDIASLALGMLRFNVFVNGRLAYENLDLSSVSFQLLASPYYADFVVNECGLNMLNVSVGPSELSSLHSVDAILNGIEIMKISNSMKSLDGGTGMDVMGGICSVLPMVAVICLLVLMSMVIKKKLATLKDSWVHAQLFLGGSSAETKYSSIPLAAKH